MFIKNRFALDIRNNKIYRRYIFLSKSQDIINKIFRHTEHFLRFSTFSEDDIFCIGSKNLLALCHKINMVKYHLIKYEHLENKYLTLLNKYVSTNKIQKGRFTIEKCELTAEYESFLLQFKATLDTLVGFLNPIYRKENKNPLKLQVTFENKGQNVIKDLKKYLRYHPHKNKFLKSLIELLEKECLTSAYMEDGSLNWLLAIIKRRDEAAHYGKDYWFSFQINNIEGEEKSVFPPRLSTTQSTRDALMIAYDNLLTFLQDFIALLLGPYLNNCFDYFSFAREEVTENAPKWYIHLKGLQKYNVKCFKNNPAVIEEYCQKMKIPVDPITVKNLYIFYNSFHKNI